MSSFSYLANLMVLDQHQSHLPVNYCSLHFYIYFLFVAWCLARLVFLFTYGKVVLI